MTMQAYPIEKKAGEAVYAAATAEDLPAYSATSPVYGAPTMDLHHVPSTDQERDFEAGLFVSPNASKGAEQSYSCLCRIAVLTDIELISLWQVLTRRNTA